MVLLMVSACWRGGGQAPEPPSAAPPLAVVAAPVASASGGYSVAGCNTGCIDCSLGDYKSYVVGMRGGARAFPSPYPPAQGYACGTQVAIGETIELRAVSSTGLELAEWRPFFDTDYCPCAGTNAATCRVTVTSEIAARHPRAYCGAVWKQKGTAQIGH